ncbi:MAG: hypothetical protein WAU88_00605 [Candidatus Zixiibacteriota bacterium]
MSDSVDSVIQKFNSLRWHDSKLRSVTVARAGGSEVVILDLELWDENWILQSSRLTLLECTYIRTELDLDSKRTCSDDISSALCKASSELIDSLDRTNPYDSFTGYLHFHIRMIPFGGVIDILAKDFVLEPKSQP